jgi:hypothetical protein
MLNPFSSAQGGLREESGSPPNPKLQVQILRFTQNKTRSSTGSVSGLRFLKVSFIRGAPRGTAGTASQRRRTLPARFFNTWHI